MAKKKTAIASGKGLNTFVKVSLEVLPELEGLIPPLSQNESELLEESIKKYGLREPIEYWENDGKQIIIDGHNRFKICKKLAIVPKTRNREFLSLEEVKDWMLRKQLGRRNLTDSNRTYLMGMLYNKNKSEHGRHDRDNSVNVAEQVAVDTGSSVRSVKNAGDFAEGIEKLAPELKKHVLSGKEKVPKAMVQELAASDTQKPIENVAQINTEVEKVKRKKIEAKNKRKGVLVPKKVAKEGSDPIVSKRTNTELNDISKHEISEEERLERYAATRAKLIEHFGDLENDILISVMNDILELRSNLSDHIKLVNDGYTILRSGDTPSSHIKHFSTDKNSWKTLENSFKSKGERDRRFKELLMDNKTIRG